MSEIENLSNELTGQIEFTGEHIKVALRSARQTADMIARGNGGREVALCITKLQEAGHWLDEALAVRGGT